MPRAWNGARRLRRFNVLLPGAWENTLVFLTILP